VSLWVAVLLGQAKVNNIDLVPTLANAHQEVIRLDIAVDEGFGMDVLNPGDELIGEEENRLQGKFAVAKVEQVLQAGTKKVENHGIVVTFRTEPANKGDANSSGQ